MNHESKKSAGGRRAWSRGARKAGVAVAAALCAGGVLLGCVATVGTEAHLVYGHPVIYAETVPADMTPYPHVYYQGEYAYLVDGVWYYPSRGGWVVFRDEPVELRHYRTTYRSYPTTQRPTRRYVPPEYSYPRERQRRHYQPR